MSIAFNADEIFEIAEQIERNGSLFYQKAARYTQDNQAKKIFNELAAMEDKHVQQFQTIREHLKTQPAENKYYDPFNESVLYLRAFAEGKIFSLKTNIELEIQEKKSLQAIIKYAIEREKDSIVFYLGMMEIIPAHFGKDKVENIIKEEMKHIRMLTEGVVI
jgi:rubrerythrin